MAELDAKKAFHALRKIYSAAQALDRQGKGLISQIGEYCFEWEEPLAVENLAKGLPKCWTFEISCRISGQSLWDGHIEEYHLHDVIGAQYKHNDQREGYNWLQWETRFPKSSHEYYVDELLQWASNVLENG